MPRFLHNKRGIFILRCKVFNFRSFVSRDIFLVRADDRAFKFVTCRSADGVSNVVVVSEFVLAARHCHEEVVSFDYLEFMNRNAAVNCQRSDCFKISTFKRFSEFDV